MNLFVVQVKKNGSVVQAKYGGVRDPPRGIIPWYPILRQTSSGHPRGYTAGASPPAAPKDPLFEDLTAPTRSDKTRATEHTANPILNWGR